MCWCVFFPWMNTFLCVAFLCVLGTQAKAEMGARHAGAQSVLLQTAFIKANQGHFKPKAAWCPRIPPACTIALPKIDMSAAVWDALGEWEFRFSL